MISDKFLSEIGLNDSQREAVKSAYKQEERLRLLLVKCGVVQGCIEPVIAATDVSTLDSLDDITLTGMIKDKWSGFIPEKKERI